MTKEKQINDILKELAKLLDVTKNEFDTITTSYKAVGNYLAEDSSPLKPFYPSIHPQGSFLLGTVVRPVSEEDDIDIDIVCELENKPNYWTQYDLKNAIGYRLKDSDLYSKKLDEEGKRCWTLLYGDNKYHLDVLPSLVCNNYRSIVENYFSRSNSYNPQVLAMHITDKTKDDYNTERNEQKWMITNPFGFAQWFLSSAQVAYKNERSILSEAKIDPVPHFGEDRFALQRVVQLLKRHRDIMFDGADAKPISIIITTLATRAYNKEINIFDALKHITTTMASYIEDRNGVKWVVNPVNPQENFADRWANDPKRKNNFYKWLDKIQADIDRLEKAFGTGLYNIKSILSEMFGENVSFATYENYSRHLSEQRANGKMRISSTGILGVSGVTKVEAHNFFGANEKEL